MGERSVTVQVRGTNGNVVDRRTKPEDRIGERGTLAVSKMLYFSSMG